MGTSSLGFYPGSPLLQALHLAARPQPNGQLYYILLKSTTLLYEFVFVFLHNNRPEEFDACKYYPPL